MNNTFNNIVIVSNKDIVIGTHFNNTTTETKETTYVFADNKLPLTRNERGANTTNTLHIINKYLRSIIKLNQQESTIINTNISNIIIPDDLYDYISKGTYKGWLKTKSYRDGRPIQSNMLETWEEFSKLYKEVFLDVEFKKLSIYKQKQPKYDIELITKVNAIIEACNKHIKEREEDLFDKIFELNA